MFQRTIYRMLLLFVFVLVSRGIGLAQAPGSPEAIVTPDGNDWRTAQSAAPAKGKLIVVTRDRPGHRQSCHVQSFTSEKLVCSRVLGESRTYLREQIAAIILPGDGHLKLRLALGLNGAAGAAVWGTVVLAATCPACAVATAIAAVVILCATGAILIADDQPDRVLYLAPGQRVTGRLGSASSW
jgi:hypothetical protein